MATNLASRALFVITRTGEMVESPPRRSHSRGRVLIAEQTLQKILGALYESPLDRTKWAEFLMLTARAAGGEAAVLALHDFNNTDSAIPEEWGLDPEFGEKYAAHYGSIDEWRVAVTKSHDWLGISEQFVPASALKRTEFYNDYLLPYDITHGMFAMIERGPGRVANISILRGRRAGSFEAPDLDIVRFLRPHIQRAYRLHTELFAARQRSVSLMTALDALSTGVILLGPKAQIVAANRAAESLLSASNGLCAGRRGLRAEHRAESARLQQVIAEAVATSESAGTSSGGAVTISRRGLTPLHVLVSPVRSFDVDHRHPVRAIIFVREPERLVRPAGDVLRTLFGLTPAECRLAILLADGYGPVEISNMIGVSRNTLKAQLASIYRKTGTSRQTQLIRLLLQVASL